MRRPIAPGSEFVRSGTYRSRTFPLVLQPSPPSRLLTGGRLLARATRDPGDIRRHCASMTAIVSDLRLLAKQAGIP